MSSKHGIWLYDEGEENINDAITLLPDGASLEIRSDIKEKIEKILNSKYFKGNDDRIYKVAEEPKKTF